MMSQHKLGNLCGYSAVCIWSLSASLIMQIQGLPTFEALSITLTVSFLCTVLRIAWMKNWAALKQPWWLWAACFLGTFGNDWTYFQAFHFAPAAHVDLISSLWPLTALMVGSLVLKRFQLTSQQWLGLGVSSLAMALLILHGTNNEIAYPDAWRGYGYALLDVLFWNVYALTTSQYPKAPIEIMGLCCGVGAICAFGLHLHTEVTLVPAVSQWWILVALGALGQCAAYMLWDFGLKRGRFETISMMSYLIPVQSVSLLVICGYAVWSFPLLTAIVGVVSGLMLAENQFKGLGIVLSAYYKRCIERYIPSLGL